MKHASFVSGSSLEMEYIYQGNTVSTVIVYGILV